MPIVSLILICILFPHSICMSPSSSWAMSFKSWITTFSHAQNLHMDPGREFCFLLWKFQLEAGKRGIFEYDYLYFDVKILTFCIILVFANLFFDNGSIHWILLLADITKRWTLVLMFQVVQLNIRSAWP